MVNVTNYFNRKYKVGNKNTDLVITTELIILYDVEQLKLCLFFNGVFKRFVMFYVVKQ